MDPSPMIFPGRSYNRQGFTLIEVLVSTALCVVVVFGLVAMDISRSRLEKEGRQNTGAGFPSRTEAALVARQIKHNIENADRVILINGGTGIQIRVLDMVSNALGNCTGLALAETPDPSCFDDGDNYRWDQFSMESGGNGDIDYFRDIYDVDAAAATCPGGSAVAASEGGDGLSMAFSEDPIADGSMNIVRYTVTWTNPSDNTDIMNFTGDATLRLRSVGANPGLSELPSVCN